MALPAFFSSPIVRKARRSFALVRQEIVGVAQDFWKDGNWESSSSFSEVVAQPVVPAKPKAPPPVFAPPSKTSKGLWHAAPGEISEHMWGAGYVTPADEYITDLLIRPLGLNKDMSMLDLAAGLGGRMRRTAEEFGVYISGREPDSEIAARGMALSVAAGLSKKATIMPYDPMSLVESRTYDCIISRETIYRVDDKAKFIKSVVACCKPKAQISFTDYVLNPEAQAQPAVRAWMAFERGAKPVGLVEMAELWAKAGISLRVHDDQTEFYIKEVKKGLARFAQFMIKGMKPDEDTRKAVEKRITTWAHRMAAMEQGMKFYRFYGLR